MKRVDVMVALAVIAASIVVAIVIHRSAPRIGVVPTGPVSRNHGETQAALEQCHDDRSAGQRHDMRATSDSL